MKKLLVLLFSLLISFNSYGEWVKLFDSQNGDSYYLDYSKIKEHNGYVYWWYLDDYLTPSIYGDMSAVMYHQSDCAMQQTKYLSYIFYEQPMGNGSSTTDNPLNPVFKNPVSGSNLEYLLEIICDYVK